MDQVSIFKYIGSSHLELMKTEIIYGKLIKFILSCCVHAALVSANISYMKNPLLQGFQNRNRQPFLIGACLLVVYKLELEFINV